MKSYSNHIVSNNPYPLVISIQLGCLLNGVVLILNNNLFVSLLFMLSLLLVVSISLFSWIENIIQEGTNLGDHTWKVQKGLEEGFNLFLLTEVILFFGVFWSWFHGILSADITLGEEWPPKGLIGVNSIELPLLNTILLLCSASSITYSHHLLISGVRKNILIWIMVTVFLALVFLSQQVLEYFTCVYSISDSLYGSVFYISTGLHILHVIFGTIFLSVSLIRILNYELTETHNLGLESGIIYWHLVDVIWLLLWLIVYWYGI